MRSIWPVFLLLVAASDVEAARERQMAAGARIRLEPDRTVWRLGENVIVRYIVENASDEPFTVDWGGDSRAIRPIRNIVQVYDADGSLLEDPWPDPPCFGGPGGESEVTMSKPLVIEIAVPRYRVFAKPGTYRIRVAHDLGWDAVEDGGRDAWMDGWVPAEDDPRWAETTIEIFEPPADRIDAVLDVMSAQPKRGDQTMLRRNRAWSDFLTIRDPAYLPALVKRARARGKWDPWWLEGIRSIETPEATKALVRLLSEETSEARAAALLDRVPLPDRMPAVIESISPVGPDRSIQSRLVEKAWREAFAEPARAWARKNLGGRYAGRIPHYAAYILASAGTPEDLPALEDGLDQALQYASADPKRLADASERGRLAMLYLAIRQLYRRGAKPPADPEKPFEIALALLWIQEKGVEGLAPYAKQVEAGLTHEETAIRDLTLRCLPRPLPDLALEHLPVLLQDPDREVRIGALQAVGETKDARFRPLVAAQLRAADDSGWMLTAEAAAEAVGLDGIDRARIHVERLGEASQFALRFGQLLWVVGNVGYSTSGVPDADERARLQRAWTAFLDAYGDALRKGKRFSPTDPEVEPLIPSTLQISPSER